MKRLIVGTAFCAALVVAAAAILVRWPMVFWLLALSACVYLVSGRRVDIEFRMDVGNRQAERKLYVAVVWKPRATAASESQVTDSGFDAMKVENRV